ncbi:VTT domain-containing protein [uncultured Algoriphagus sp.]|uniref:TVP38/TMEM64 family protein n=1 Tax=uncultured Algoriphagus sp. TaxID=417365 RepID=UPI0030ED56D2|tara:strand:+ start:31797 stop:32510 length:714 start_codon:yes stop_codon:yes gene_type:complete
MKESTSSTPSKKSNLPLYFSILLVTGLVVCYFAIPDFNQFIKTAWRVLTSDDEATIKKWVEDFGWIGPMLIILAMVVQMFLLVIPSLLLMIVAVLAYGPIWGSVISFTSVIIASSLGYLIGGLLGKSFVIRLLGEKTIQKISQFIEEYGFWAVSITRINPFLSNDAISFVTGILKMNYSKFIGATALGITPLILLIAVTGENTDSLKTGLMWGSLVCVLIFAGYIFWDRNRKRTRKK